MYMMYSLPSEIKGLQLIIIIINKYRQFTALCKRKKRYTAILNGRNGISDRHAQFMLLKTHPEVTSRWEKLCIACVED